MTPKIAGEGHSFKGAFLYYLNDKRADPSDPHPVTSVRVAWTETRNLATDEPHMAWRIMRATAAEADALKRAAGIKNTGRKATGGPVFSYSLSWEPDAAASLTREEMAAFADRSIKALGASHLQAVIICHTDTAHPHVHVVINRIDPITGKAHPFGQSKNKLSDLAAFYERERGKIVTPKRQKAAEAREDARKRPKVEDGPNASWTRRRRDEKARQQAEAQQHDHAFATLTRDRSTFSRQDLARHVYRHTDSAETFRAVLARLEASPELVAVGRDEHGRERFTTRGHQAIERRMLDHAVTLRDRAGRAVHPLGPMNLTLSDDQTAALRHVVGAERLSLIVGIAGTGKSTMMGAAKRSWEAKGLTVRGLALSGIAADSLKTGSGIDSQTIHSRLWRWEQGSDLPTSKEVIVVDEAGMIGSRQMERILFFARQGRAKVVLIGDSEQLQAIEAGGAFRMMADRFGAVSIDTVRRQRETWQQDATRELARAATAAAVDRYEAAGMVHQHRTQDDAKAVLIAAWREDAAAHPEKSQIILAFKRIDVRDLNDRARALRREAGELGEDHALETAAGKRPFAAGDRMYFLKNDSALGVRNGTLATVERIERKTVTVKLDGDTARRVTFDIESYNNITHGYAATIHKSQGVTVDRAHLLASSNLDRHSTYVAMSRHRDRVDVHWSAESFDSRDALLRRLGRAAVKDTSLDYETDAPGMAMRQMSEQAAKSLRIDGEPPKLPARVETAGNALKLSHDAQKARLAAERAKLWPEHQARRATIYGAAGAEIRSCIATAKAENRPAWADHHRRQKVERRQYDQRERYLAGVVWNAVRMATAHQIPGDGSNAGFLTAAFAYLVSGNARREGFERRQKEEGNQLSAALNARTDRQVGQMKEARDRLLAESRATFTDAKAEMFARHGQEVTKIRGEWRALYAERDRQRAERAEQAQAVREAERTTFRVKLRIKDSRSDTRAAWSNEQTRREGTAARYVEARPALEAPAQEPQAVKNDYDRARDMRPVAPPVPNRTEILSRPTPAPSPAGDVPAAKREPAPVPAIDKAEAWAKRHQQGQQTTPQLRREWMNRAAPPPEKKPAPERKEWRSREAEQQESSPSGREWQSRAAPPQQTAPTPAREWTSRAASVRHDASRPEVSEDNDHDM